MVGILIFGCHGQVGSSLVSQLMGRDDVHITALDIEDVDLSDEAATRQAVLEAKPDWVINTSAYTAVDQAESDPDLAHRIYAVAPGVIAAACTECGAAMVHYSTDYVFDGDACEPYMEEDTPNPQSVYGRTKLDGERAVFDACPRAVLLRTAWVYSPGGKNFVNTMLRLAGERDEIRVVNDQFGSPTLAEDLARATIAIVDQLDSDKREDCWGIYHATGRGVTNWAGFSEAIMTESGNDHVNVIPIPGNEYPTPAPRPSYSVLSNEKLWRVFGIELPTWQEALTRCLGQK